MSKSMVMLQRERQLFSRKIRDLECETVIGHCRDDNYDDDDESVLTIASERQPRRKKNSPYLNGRRTVLSVAPPRGGDDAYCQELCLTSRNNNGNGFCPCA